jgi:hypothetical protein
VNDRNHQPAQLSNQQAEVLNNLANSIHLLSAMNPSQFQQQQQQQQQDHNQLMLMAQHSQPQTAFV